MDYNRALASILKAAIVITFIICFSTCVREDMAHKKELLKLELETGKTLPTPWERTFGNYE